MVCSPDDNGQGNNLIKALTIKATDERERGYDSVSYLCFFATLFGDHVELGDAVLLHRHRQRDAILLDQHLDWVILHSQQLFVLLLQEMYENEEKMDQHLVWLLILALHATAMVLNGCGFPLLPRRTCDWHT